jgi:hypothetical protein
MGVHTMGCLHRNITLATLQVASLLRCAELIGGTPGAAVLQRINPYARKMAGLIGRINGGTETYRQKCLQHQVSLANAKGAIDGLRRALGQCPLTAGVKNGNLKPQEGEKPEEKP